MKGYKGFNPDMTCNNKQYSENTTFEEPKAKICKCGMHFCKNPLDVWDYYPLINDDGKMNVFAEVEALDEVQTDDNKKYCTKKLKIRKILRLDEFIKAAVKFAIGKSELTSTGDKSQLASTGDFSKLASTGDGSQLASTGNCTQLASSGDYSKLASSGDYTQLASTGKNSVVCGIGVNNIAKAAIGSWITLAEWKFTDDGLRPVCVKTEYVDGTRIKADTFYKLENGEFKEVRVGQSI